MQYWNNKEFLIRQLDYIIYDGECYLCSSSIGLLATSLDLKQTIPYQNISGMKHAGEKGMIVIAGNRRWIGGEAVLQIGLRLKGILRFTSIIFSLPILQDLFKVGYQKFAGIRHRINQNTLSVYLSVLQKLLKN